MDYYLLVVRTPFGQIVQNELFMRLDIRPGLMMIYGILCIVVTASGGMVGRKMFLQCMGRHCHDDNGR